MNRGAVNQIHSTKIRGVLVECIGSGYSVEVIWQDGAVNGGYFANAYTRVTDPNVFNHPQPASPNLDINATVPFGNIASKTGGRALQAQMRLEF